MEVRTWGKNPRFRSLEYLIGSDGTPATWLPAARVRRGELEVRSELLGVGAFAEVMKGELRIPCAVKRAKGQGQVQQKDLLEFVREGEMMRAVCHPNVVRLLGVMTDGGQPLLLQNLIYIEKTGTVKLCDFGLARLMPFGVTSIDPKHLGTGGTPAYQGPEVLRRQPVGLKLDVYGFAVSLWELYTGKLPWADCNLDQMTTRVAVQKERPPIPQDMPRDYADIINSCWHDDPTQRPHFASLLEQLRDMTAAATVGSNCPGTRLTTSAASTASTANGSPDPVAEVPVQVSTVKALSTPTSASTAASTLRPQLPLRYPAASYAQF